MAVPPHRSFEEWLLLARHQPAASLAAFQAAYRSESSEVGRGQRTLVALGGRCGRRPRPVTGRRCTPWSRQTVPLQLWPRTTESQRQRDPSDDRCRACSRQTVLARNTWGCRCERLEACV